MIIKALIRNHDFVFGTFCREWLSKQKDQDIIIEIIPAARPQDQKSRLFHKLVDVYSNAMGIGKLETKVQFKYLFGTWTEFREAFIPPTWPGAFIEIYNKIIFLKSTTRYTSQEWAGVIDGAIASCVENHIDISFLEPLG